MIEGDRARPVDSLGDDRGLVALVGQLATDARDLAHAEIDLVKARVREAVRRYKVVAILFAAAGILGLAALIALLVGLIETLATLVGPGFATLIVVGAVVVIAAVLALVGKSRLTGAAPR